MGPFIPASNSSVHEKVNDYDFLLQISKFKMETWEERLTALPKPIINMKKLIVTLAVGAIAILSSMAEEKTYVAIMKGVT